MTKATKSHRGAQKEDVGSRSSPKVPESLTLVVYQVKGGSTQFHRLQSISHVADKVGMTVARSMAHFQPLLTSPAEAPR